MVMLRSREIQPPPPKPEPEPELEPVTPAQMRESSACQSPRSSQNRRRSLRLACNSGQNPAFEVKCEGNSVNSEAKLNSRLGIKRKVDYTNNNNTSGDDDELVIEVEEKESNVTDKESETKEIEKGKGKVSEKLEKNNVSYESSGLMCRKRRYSREEKGKTVFDGGDSLNSTVKDEGLDLGSKAEDFDGSSDDNVVVLEKNGSIKRGNEPTRSRMDQFRDIARRNASRFAHFDCEEQDEQQLPSVDAEMSSVEDGDNVEDWPGPFSTAMKIIRDRANKLNSQKGASNFGKAEPVPVTWVPRTRQGMDWSRKRAPSLQQLCTEIIVKNVDAVTSLDHVPDALRHKLCQQLCDSRRMNSYFLDLLVRGSPTEIRVKDCSWMTEEELMKCFEGCDTKNITVLQLDQCGRCMPDYVLPATLARSAKSMPALITLSLKGACRLSDIGMNSVVSSATSLRSINLSQCSLISSTSISTLADSLGSVLRELYIDDCQGLDAMLILPALKKFEHLQVLSVARIQTVCDDFVRELVLACGHNIKELGLAECMKLTDSSMKVIAETCTELRALDLVSLRKLTDSALGYLANGCREIQTLRLCGDTFSDESIAAFVESSGELLKELSLNNVKKVGHSTAISLARRSRNLVSLDLSWCRNLSNEAVGLIVDSCSSLRMLKLFGCGQITNVFLNGHSNPEVRIIGLKMSPVLEHIWVPDSQEYSLRYSSAHAFM